MQWHSELQANRDGIGRQIRPHKFDRNSSNYEHYFEDVPETMKHLAYAISNAPFPGNPLIETGEFDKKTGQVKYKSRGLDVSPNDLDYLFRQVFGGTYGTIAEQIEVLSDPSQAEAHSRIFEETSDILDPSKNPWLRKIWTYKPSKDLDQTYVFKGLNKSRKHHLRYYELETIETALDAMYEDGKITLTKHNKIWKEIYDNQADLDGIPKDIREVGTYETDLDIPNPKYKKFRGPKVKGRKTEKKSLGTKKGDLSDALDIIKEEKQRRTEDRESMIGPKNLEIPE